MGIIQTHIIIWYNGGVAANQSPSLSTRQNRGRPASQPHFMSREPCAIPRLILMKPFPLKVGSLFNNSARGSLPSELMSEEGVMRRKVYGDPTSASQDPWELAKSRFLEDLEPHEKDLFNNATLENIYYSTSNANRDDAENSKTRGVVRRLGPLVSAIETYGGAFDTFAQISPQYLSPIWGSIRVVLVVASSYGKFYDKIVDTLSRIGDILPRFRELKLYGVQPQY